MSGVLSGQILNVESLRRERDTSGWSGFANVSLDLSKTKNQIFRIQNKLQVQYHKGRHLGLFINYIDFKEANSKALISKGTQHLRYNYDSTDRLTWEVFVQGHYDFISSINFRVLTGAGPRYALSKSEKHLSYIGLLSMYEYEIVRSESENTNKTHVRNSSYFSMTLYPSANIGIISTTYYQPEYSNFSDFRISNDTAIAFRLFDDLKFTFRFGYQYDTHPALGIPKEQYKLTNGVAYVF